MVSTTPRVRNIAIDAHASAFSTLTAANAVLFFTTSYLAARYLAATLLQAEFLYDITALLFAVVHDGFLIFCAFNSWRAIGTFNTVTLRRLPIVTAGLAIIFTLHTLNALNLLFGDASGFSIMLAAFTLTLVAVPLACAIVALISSRRIRRRLIPSTDVTVAGLFSRSLPDNDRGTSQTRTRGSAPWRAAAFIGAGLLVLVGVTLVSVELGIHFVNEERLEHIMAHNPLLFAALRYSSQLEFFLQICGFALLLRARRYLQAKADDLLSVDRRKPIVFLRSFEDDEKGRLWTSQRQLVDFSLEARLADHFQKVGPFVAIGSPAETLPVPGAARVRLSDSDWQSKVLKWITEASVIIMYAGKTRWVNWELSKVVENNRVHDLILIVPQGNKWLGRAKRREVADRMNIIREAFMYTAWHDALSRIREVGDVRVVLFRVDGAIVVISSKKGGRGAYQLAALVGLHVLRNSRHDR